MLWATDVGDGATDVPLCCAHAVGKVNLSSFGKIIRDNIHRANSVYDDKKILQYVIMPNHIHFILKIGAGVSGTSRAPSPTILNITPHKYTQKKQADGFPEQAVPTAAKKTICLIIFAKISNSYSV